MLQLPSHWIKKEPLHWNVRYCLWSCPLASWLQPWHWLLSILQIVLISISEAGYCEKFRDDKAWDLASLLIWWHNVMCQTEWLCQKFDFFKVMLWPFEALYGRLWPSGNQCLEGRAIWIVMSTHDYSAITWDITCLFFECKLLGRIIAAITRVYCIYYARILYILRAYVVYAHLPFAVCRLLYAVCRMLFVVL